MKYLLTFLAKKYQELHGKADGGKKEKKPADKPKAQPTKEKPAVKKLKRIRLKVVN